MLWDGGANATEREFALCHINEECLLPCFFSRLNIVLVKVGETSLDQEELQSWRRAFLGEVRGQTFRGSVSIA